MSKRSPDERSDIRVSVVPIPTYRLANAGYLLKGSAIRVARSR